MIRRRFMNKVDGVEELPYLTIEALEDGLTASLSTNACQYSTDGVTWNDLTAGIATPAINTGEKLYFKATELTPKYGIGKFTVSKQFNLSGNCMSMLFGDEAKSNLDLTGYNYAFYNLFYNCTTLKSVSSEFLPATTLANYCYCSMFFRCTELTSTPKLPAMILADSCYSSMFNGTNVLPDCTNIDFSSQAVLQSGGLKGLFSGTKVTDSDLRSILPINPDTGNYWLPVTTLTSNCYKEMFSSCTGLTTAPDLPAISLASHCYDGMFSSCSSLTTVPELPATTLADNCYYSMFKNCSRLTTAPELPATTLATYCYYSMFENCTGLTTAPVLPATTLIYGCYQYMFQYCSKLNYIKAMFTATPSIAFTNNWVSGVASTGTFVKNSAAAWNVTGVNGVPSGWTVETASV